MSEWNSELMSERTGAAVDEPDSPVSGAVRPQDATEPAAGENDTGVVPSAGERHTA